MKCKNGYKDAEKYRKYRNGYNQRYYKKTRYAENSKKPWGGDEIALILEKKHTDAELSEMLGRSVKAIQIKRHYLKNPR